MIKGLIPTLAEGGKIKIGGLGETRKGSNGNYRLPVKHDFFTITTTRRDGAGDLIVDEALMAELATDQDGKVRELPIVLHDDEIENVFPTTYALYSGKKLFCRGDGEHAIRKEMRGNEWTGATSELKCPCEFLGAKGKMTCKPHGTLHCSIRVPGRAVAGSVYKWRTTSLISIQRMIGSLQQIQGICGTLCGIPLMLKLEPIDVAPPDAPASTVYCCHVELRAADIQAVQRDAIAASQMRAKVRASIGYQALLAPPALDETPEEQAEIAQEFHPEAEVDTGEAASDEQTATVNVLIDQLEAHNPGAWMRIFEQATGGATDISSITAQQADRAADALRTALAATVKSPSRSNGNGGDKIAEPMRKALFAAYRRAGHSDADVGAWLQKHHGIADTTDIARGDFEAIRKRLSDMAPLSEDRPAA